MSVNREPLILPSNSQQESKRARLLWLIPQTSNFSIKSTPTVKCVLVASAVADSNNNMLHFFFGHWSKKAAAESDGSTKQEKDVTGLTGLSTCSHFCCSWEQEWGNMSSSALETEPLTNWRTGLWRPATNPWALLHLSHLQVRISWLWRNAPHPFVGRFACAASWRCAQCKPSCRDAVERVFAVSYNSLWI